MTYLHDTELTYVSWEFGTIWVIDPEHNDGYPLLDLFSVVGFCGNIDAQSHRRIVWHLLRMWARRNGVYVPVTGHVKYGGVYKSITTVYRRVDGIYKK